MKKPICGIGINDADYTIHEYRFEINSEGKKIRIPTWTCPYYTKWTNMLKRCYDPLHRAAFPTYEGCYICDDWVYFTKFKAWMETQDWKGNQLDKDILFPGNKLYSPNTCVFVSPKVNSFVLEHDGDRGAYPIGVTLDKKSGKFIAQCCPIIRVKPSNRIGSFNTPEEAHQAWLSYKLEQAYILAKMQPDERVAEALIHRYENYQSV